MRDPAVLQGRSFAVTGHSLGGYLAAAIKSSFPQATQGYLFNALGVGGVFGNVADSLASVLGLGNIFRPTTSGMCAAQKAFHSSQV
ncbi:MAG: hypothetical protein LZF61_07835 [Nitrosomonas sp.]|nr:MAG: hypothetical protein LZF61_07835 [Nitrosomonas sp.]